MAAQMTHFSVFAFHRRAEQGSLHLRHFSENFHPFRAALYMTLYVGFQSQEGSTLVIIQCARLLWPKNVLHTFPPVQFTYGGN